MLLRNTRARRSHWIQNQHSPNMDICFSSICIILFIYLFILAFRRDFLIFFYGMLHNSLQNDCFFLTFCKICHQPQSDKSLWCIPVGPHCPLLTGKKKKKTTPLTIEMWHHQWVSFVFIATYYLLLLTLKLLIETESWLQFRSISVANFHKSNSRER